jgi:ubiquitin-protein ligase
MSLKRKLLDVETGRRALEAHGFHVATDDNIHDVHFLMPGPAGTPYEGGLYHGLLRLDECHPLKPPTINMFTPSGRFLPVNYPVPRTDRGICTTNTVYHANEWSPLNNVENILIGFQSFMADESEHGIRSILQPAEQRRQMARQSHAALAACPVVARLFDLNKT